MNITWVTRSFSNYRIPVYEEINKRSNNGLTLIYNSEAVSVSCDTKVCEIFGKRAIGLKGELSFGNNQDALEFANTTIRIPYQKGLVSVIKKTKPDIIITDGFFQWTTAAYWLKFFYGVPLIMLYERTFHTERIAPWWRSGIRRVFARFIDKIGCNGSLTFEYLENGLKIPKHRLFTGNMAADTITLEREVYEYQHEIASSNHTNSDELIFLYVGRLIKLKGLKEMLLAWKSFVTEDMNVKLKIVGGGVEKDILKNLIIDEVINKVELIGEIDHSTIFKYYATADIFIIPTLEDNWSLVVPEAMSCSLPIICSKYNGCWPELVTHDNGWVFDPLNEMDFINVFNSSWQERNKWEEMGMNSKKIVANYSPKIIGEKIYNGILSALKK